MADTSPTFKTNAGETIGRHLMIACINTGTSVSATWKPVGSWVEDSSLEFDYNKETVKDILNKTHTVLHDPVITQTFDGAAIDAGDPAMVMLWETAIRDHDVAKLANMDMLIIHDYYGLPDSGWAERYSSCAVEPTSFGGAGGGMLTMPFEVTYGGDRTVGTATHTESGGVTTITFTPETSGGSDDDEEEDP